LATALAHGVPSIAADVEGLQAWLAGEPKGLRVPPGDTDALSAAILELLADPARARTLGRSGRSYIASSFPPERQARELASLYRDALATEADARGPHARTVHRPAFEL
jgi:D-inositol-3-phosphate glycosyltransferase